jgi:hypothetical protein
VSQNRKCPEYKTGCFSCIFSLFFVRVAENRSRSTPRIGKTGLAPPENINEAAAYWDSTAKTVGNTELYMYNCTKIVRNMEL